MVERTWLPAGGGLFGAPSAAHRVADTQERRVALEEAAFDRAQVSGVSRSKVIQRLGQSLAQGIPPQQAFAQLMSDPELATDIANYDNFSDELGKVFNDFQTGQLRGAELANKKNEFSQTHDLAERTEGRVARQAQEGLGLEADRVDLSRKQFGLEVVRERMARLDALKEDEKETEKNAAFGRATREVNRRIAEGMAPEQAFIDYYGNTEEGMGDGIVYPEVVEEMRAQVEMLKGETTKAGPGETIFRTSRSGGDMTAETRTPTTSQQDRNAGIVGGDTQDVIDMATLAELDPGEVARAMLQDQAEGGDNKTQAERATQRMVETGTMTSEQRDEFLAGVNKYEALPADEFNERAILEINQITGQTGVGDLGRERRPQGTSGVEVERAAGSGEIPRTGIDTEYKMPGLDSPKYGKAEMFLGAGAAPIVKGLAGNIARQAGSQSNVGLIDRNRKQAYNQVRYALTSLRPEGTMMMGKEQWQLVENLLPDWGAVIDPLDAVGNGILFAQQMEKLRQSALTRSEKAVTASARQTAADMANKLEGVIDALPPFESMVRLQEDLYSGQLQIEPLEGLGDSISAIEEGAARSLAGAEAEMSAETDARDWYVNALRDPAAYASEIPTMAPNLTREQRAKLAQALREQQNRGR